VQLAGENQRLMDDGGQSLPVAGQILVGALHPVQPEQSLVQSLAWPPGIVLRGADGVVLGGLHPFPGLQQHVALYPVHLCFQPLVAGVPVKQILALGAGAAPLPERHGGGQGAGHRGQCQQRLQAVRQLLRGEGHGQTQGEIEVGGGELAGVLVLLQQQEHAAGREQAQVVCFMQQPDSLVGLVVILAAKNGIEGVLAPGVARLDSKLASTLPREPEGVNTPPGSGMAQCRPWAGQR